MHALRLDFLHPIPLRRSLGVMLLGAGVLVAAVATWRYYTLVAEIDALGARLADTKRLARRDLARVRQSARDPKATAQEITRANLVLASLSVPWDAMFSELEAAASPEVTLLGIAPEASGRQVRLSGEARRYEDLLAYVTRLEQTAGFAQVFLAGHELKAGGATRPVTFTLTAEWVGRL